MAIITDIQYACETDGLPDESQIQKWVMVGLEGLRENAELTVRIVDEDEGKALNKRWSKKNAATNVLSFPAEGIENIVPNFLGDIVICVPVVAKEALQQNKLLEAHWAHMVIHGTLHLISYDHIQEDDAEEMESLEINILKKLGFDNPYN